MNNINYMLICKLQRVGITFLIQSKIDSYKNVSVLYVVKIFIFIPNILSKLKIYIFIISTYSVWTFNLVSNLSCEKEIWHLNINVNSKKEKCVSPGLRTSLPSMHCMQPNLSFHMLKFSYTVMITNDKN